MINTSRANGRSAIQLLGLKVERASRLPLSRAQAQANVQAGETHCPTLVAHSSIPKRDAANINETAPGSAPLLELE